MNLEQKVVIWASINRPDLYFIGEDLDETDKFAYAFIITDFPELELYSKIYNYHGFISLDNEYIGGNRFRPIIPW